MSRPTKSVIDHISKDHETMGEAWFQSVALPYHETSAHAALLEGDADFIQKAQASFGHRCAKHSNGVSSRPEGAAVNLSEWNAKYGKCFKDWNVDTPAGVRRWQALESGTVGAVLCVARRGTMGTPCITVIGGPTVTPIDSQAIVSAGAPNWRRIFGDDDMISLYLERGSSYSHSVVGSLGSFTREIIPTDLDELACPVMMMPLEHFSLCVYNPESSATLPFKTLFLPMYSNPPIGIYWPVDIGFDRFLETVSGPKPYQAFAKLLRENKAEFGWWFEAAADKAVTMTVTLRAVTTNLWTTFPTPDNLDDEQTADTRRVAPFQQQQDSFRWSYYVDCILNGPGTTQEEVLDHQALLSYLGQVEEYIPKPDVPWANCPPSRWPFLPHLFQMTHNSRVTQLLEPFLDVDRSTQVPVMVTKFPVIDLSPRMSGQDFHDAQDLHDSGVPEDLDPDFGVRQMVSASPGAQFEHRHNTRQRKRVKTTHPTTARGISPSPLFGDVSPTRGRRRHQGSPQPSMSSTADSATELQVVGVRQAPIAPVTADRSHDRSRRVDFGLTAGRRLDYDDQAYAPPGRPAYPPYASSGTGAGAPLGS